MIRYLLAATAASALLALAILPPQRSAQDANISQAATARIEAGHMLVQDSVEATLEARRLAARRADAELSANRQAANEAVERAAAVSKSAKPVHMAAIRPAPEALPLPVASPIRPAAPQQVAEVTPKPPMTARVVGTVERIPRWLGSKIVNAAVWVVELPGQVVTRLPERRFL